MIPQTINQKQVTRTLRAIEQRGDYSCTLGELTARTDCGELKIPVVFVRNTKRGVTYTVRFRRQGVPVCNCGDAQNPAHRGSNLCCKHSILAQEFVNAGQVQRDTRTAEERKAQALKDRELWD